MDIITWDTRVDEACRNRELSVLKELITPENVNTTVFKVAFSWECTPVEACCRHSAPECVKWLVDVMGATLGNSLYYACWSGEMDIVKYVLGKVHDYHVDAFSVDGVTPLAILMQYRCISIGDGTTKVHRIVKLLLQHGARTEKVKYYIVPAWVHAYQRDIDKKRSSCAATGCALLWVLCRRRGAPRDMAGWWVRNYVLSEWFE